MKRISFDNSEFRKYLLYALGEIALIIIGIVIALQIDNWNTEKIQRASLKSYLHTIAANINSDLASLEALRSERIRAYELGLRWLYFPPRGRAYSVPEVALASRALDEASTLRHFIANSSGYEALKSSGILDQMQGKDIEKVLYDYYDTAARIAYREQDHNELTRLLSLQVLARWPDNMALWELSSAPVLTVDRFRDLQPAFRSVLLDPTTLELVGKTISVGRLLLEYDTLDRLGRAFQRLIEVDSLALDPEATGILDSIVDPRSNIGYSDVVTDGQVSWHAYILNSSDANDPRVSYQASAEGSPSPFDTGSLQRIADSLHIRHHGGAAWAGIWFVAGTNFTDRQSSDYSMYSKLVLELKGDVGGEKIVINMEDRDDPADGSSTRYEIELSDQWQTYEIALAEFKTADLTKLSVPLGFVFLEQPVSFSLRTAKFVK